MKIQTIHKNACGEVLNPVSAVGFRVEDDNGRVLEVRISDGMVTIQTQGSIINAEFLPQLLQMFERDMSCYECGLPVKWLAPDSRCGNCTQVTVDEVRGHDPD